MADNSAEKNSDSERDERVKKLEALTSAGLVAYPAKVERDYEIAAVLSDFAKHEKAAKDFNIVGRLRAKREHGNLVFANLEDASGSMQLVVSKKDLGADSFKNFIKFIDVADFIQVSGHCFVTARGEQSLMVVDWKLLTKALLPIPDAWYGLKNEDERLRKRYLDLLLNPELKELFRQKSRFWEVTREFMKSHGFFEVETPTLETTTGGAEANPFQTHHNDFDLDVFMRISVGELWQKRLMAAGYERVFEIGRVYRNEGSSPDHLQEFTNMEFYWAYADYEMGMKLAQELYQDIAQKVFGKTKFSTKGFEYDLAGEWPRLDYRSEVIKQTGVDVIKATEKEMMAVLEKLKVKYEGDNKERLTDTLWKYCRKNIAGPVFLINHPKLVSPLSKAKTDDPELTERFQIIIAGSEIGNGFSELNDPVDQRQRFEEQQTLIDRGDKEAMMPDWEFVEMLEHGIPPTCGFGFGERLFAFLVDKPVREVTLFPLMRPKADDLKKEDK
ncbi:lysine--tRNA ligase [Candidatus Falkowbacteria bacterium]|uniref:Lysine--tRNA ligase n=1 Tax=Candidatus Falkowbacteria bacterium CG10_big_fil_rev_8_21_14_0_10_37_18 TaxID=1974562 RepID=A0A2H0VAS0_9BACT|nr:lysine--tRNA ligase [Candidatus Falkowbacteria bacterium]NCQ12917.1 lysine--tRNA ligase [Candidatus Falkowbacteria bacterium]OIO06347.1 MAG: lysine--tRNA ligase [Candidatus Falkowbacteria bacterium CG1_02_37_21]PIR95410.1 MAG: lysine--tRNA ligase [Candidatus Falkowbacteria bacterium CG10_big_fil_rev_8_21_14_0_10_37_18]